MITFVRTLDEAINMRLAEREDSIKRAHEHCEADLAQMRKGAAILEELQRVLPPECLESNNVYSHWAYESAMVRIKDSYEARAAVARAVRSHLEETGKSAKDPKTGEIYVWLRAARRPELKFYYVTRVQPGDPCQFVTETKAETKLVCAVPKPQETTP